MDRGDALRGDGELPAISGRALTDEAQVVGIFWGSPT
jgi:hypothetical protein